MTEFSRRFNKSKSNSKNNATSRGKKIKNKKLYNGSEFFPVEYIDFHTGDSYTAGATATGLIFEKGSKRPMHYRLIPVDA